jgi:PKD repeat protein
MPAGDYTFSQWSDGNLNQTRQYTQGGTLSYTVRDNQNCIATSNTATITFDNSLQNVRLGNDTTLCQGNNIQLAQTSPSIVSYLWSTNATTSSIPVLTSGQYDLQVTNSNGCIKSDIINIEIQGQSPTIQLSFPSQFCQNELASFSESSFVQSGEAIASRIWNFGNNTNSSLSNGTFSNNIVETYNGTLTVNSVSGCQSTQPFSYNVRPKPLANYTSPLLCDNVTGLFTNTSTAPSSTITASQWLVNDVVNASTTNLNYAHPTIGSYNLKLVVTNGFGCRDTSVQVQIVINTYPVPNAPNLSDPFNGKTVLSIEQIPFSWSSVSDNYFYELQFSTSSSFGTLLSTQTTTQTSRTLALNTSGTVYWRVKSNNPCLLGGTSSVFTLNSIHITDSLKLWLKADAGINLSSGGVSQWVDQSGRGNHATQTTATLRPTVFTSPTLNNAPVIRFDGTDDVLTGTTIPNINSDNMTLFVLNSGNSQSGNMAGLFNVGSLTNGLSVTRSISTTQAFRVWTNNSAQLTSLANSAPTSGYLPKIVTMSREVGVQGNLSVNGSQQATTTNAPFLAPFTNATYQIGKAPGYSTLNGEVAEIILFNSILSATEQSNVEKYLKDKYAPPIKLGADIFSSYGFCDTTIVSTGYFTNYLWSNGATTSNLTVNNPGTYWVRATDIFGRISSDTINVVRPVYDSIALQNRIVCYNALIEETAFVPTGYSFVNWNDGNTNQTRLLNQNESLSYTIADNRNCQLTSNNALITIDSSLFAISLGNDTSLCVGNTIQLQLSSPAISGYSWNTGITTATQQLDTTGLYILQVQNVNNCFQRDSIFITIIGNSPVINYSFPTESCQFDEVQFSQSSTVQGSTIETTTWTIGNNAPILASSSQFTFNQPQVIPISLEVISTANCRSIANFSITVWPKPIVNFSTENFCPYQEITFNPSNQVNTQLQSFDWNFGQAASATNTSQLANPSHFYGLEGTYSVNLKVIDEHGCKDTVIQNVLVQPAPISSFSVQNTCENTTVEFTNTSSISVGYSIQTNLWNYGDNTSATNPTTGKEYSAYGDYVIELITVGNNGCSDTSSQSITVFPNPILNWSITPSCKNTLTVFEDLSTIPEGTLVSTDWLVNLQYPISTPIASYRFATLGVQYLNLTSTSDQGCTSDTLIIVNVNPELDARFSYSPSIVVAGVPVTFNDLSIGSTSATWDLGKGESLINYTPPINQFTTTYTAEWIDSLIDVTLFVENQFGCKDTLTKSFGVISPAFDLAVKSIFIQEINGFNTVGVEFENVGTISINKIDFELSGLNTLPIQETWNGTLLPNQDQIYMFNAKLSAYNSTQDELTNFLCVEGFASDVIGNVDVIKINDKVCENTENEELALLSVAPNPTDNLTNVSLLIPSKTDVTILNVSLYSMNGSIVQYVIKDQSLEAGIFDFNVDLTNVQRGIYLLKIEDGTTTKVIRLSKI